MPPYTPISSRQNPRFRAALALRDAGERRERRQLLVDGAREIGRALDAGLRPLEAWLAGDSVHADAVRALIPRLASSGAEVIDTSPELLARLSYGDRQDGLVVVLAEPSTELARLGLPERPLVAVVEHVEKPGNLGALLRSADGAGVDAVIVADPVSDPWNPNTIRASLGTIFAVPLAVASASEAQAFLRARGITLLAARVDASLDYDEADLTGAVAIVVGAETTGLTDTWAGADVTAIRIPMQGLADSLNVSASAAVLFFEAQRQRRVTRRGAGSPD